MDELKIKRAIDAIDNLALKGAPFRFREAFGEANEAVGFPRMDQQSACYRLADRHLQKRRKQGSFRCFRQGRNWIWIITTSGYGILLK